MSASHIVIIMAGGLGKRMNSDLPKVLHKILHKPMLVHVVQRALDLNPDKILIVVGKYKPVIESTLSEYVSSDKIEFVIQPEPLGTGHAIQCCIPSLAPFPDHSVLILSGDTPLVQLPTLRELATNIGVGKILTTVLRNPSGYGRIIFTPEQKFKQIIEEKDCSPLEKFVRTVNCGMYAFRASVLCKYLPLLNNNNSQQEYYLTDIVELIKLGEHPADIEMMVVSPEDQYEITGVNTPEQLRDLEHRMVPFSMQTANTMFERWAYR